MIKKSIANCFTLLNMVLGLSSIIIIALSLDRSNVSFDLANHYICLSCYIIFIAAVIDVFDGKIARKLGTSGEFGKQIDSLADLISFCFYPSFLLFGYFYNQKNNPVISDWFIYICISFPLIFGAIRLAKFNAYPLYSESDDYLGLPTPANGMFIASMILFLVLYDNGANFFVDWLHNFLNNENNLPIIISLFSSLLMVTKVKYYKFPTISFNLNIKNTIILTNILFFLILIIIGFIYNMLSVILFVSIFYYILIGLLRFFLSSIINNKSR